MKKLIFVLLALASTFAFSQTTVAPFVNPKVQFFNGAVPCSGCLLSTFAAGQSTPLATYSESTGTTPNANPVVLDANGMASIYLTSASYKFVLKTAANVTIWTQDGVSWLTPLTTFPQGSVAGNFDITQPTAAINGANQSSFSSCIHGTFFNVASLDDKWCFQNVIGTGTSPTSTLTLTHSGSSGAANFSVPGNVSVGGTLGVTSINGIQYVSSTGDIGANINTAIAAFGTAPACGTIILPKGNFSTATTINFTNREGCLVRGQGDGQAASSATTAIKWTGTSGATVWTVSSVRWSTFQDFTIDGNSLAGRGIDFTAVNAVGASQKDVFQRITILGVTQSPSQNTHVGSSTNDQVSESALTDITHINCVTCVFQEGTQTANIRYVGGMFEGYTTIGLDLEGGSSTTVQGVDFEDTISTGTSVKGADLAALTNVTFIEDYFEELAGTNVAYSFPSGAGARHAPTTVIGGRVLFPSLSTTQVVFDFEQHANLVMVGTLFTSNAPGQGGVIKMSAVGGTPNINSFHQVTLQNSWTIAALGSNSSLLLDNATATTQNVSTMQTRGSGLELWSGAIQLDDATGVGKYRILTNSNEYRMTDASGAIISLEQGQNGHFATEAASGSGRAGLDGLFADSTAHRWQMNNNNGGRTSIAGFADNLGVFASGGTITPAAIVSGGTAAALTGTGACATITTQTGGAWAGRATCTGTTGVSTLTITPGSTAPNGWACYVQDQTTRANLFQQTATVAGSCTLTATSVTQNDVFVFGASSF